MEKLEAYIEELRKERDRYFEMGSKSITADSRGWLLNRIIGDLEDIDRYLNEREYWMISSYFHLTDQGGK